MTRLQLETTLAVLGQCRHHPARSMQLQYSILIVFGLTPLVASAIEIRSDVAHGYYVCDVTEEALAKTSPWSDYKNSPPLSIVDAVRYATSRLDDLEKANANEWKIARLEWDLARVELVQEGTKHWYYVVTFRSHQAALPPSNVGRINRGGNPYKTPRDLKIPVLMNGEIPELVEHRYSEDMLELLQDLGVR